MAEAVVAARHLVQHVLELLLRSRALDHRLLLREARDDPHHALLLGGARGELLLAAPLVHDLQHRAPLRPHGRLLRLLLRHPRLPLVVALLEGTALLLDELGDRAPRRLDAHRRPQPLLVPLHTFALLPLLEALRALDEPHLRLRTTPGRAVRGEV